MLKAGDPVISVDAKKKELVGRFKNAAARGGPRGSHRRSIPEISPAWRKARHFPMGFTTPGKIGRWSMWESAMTQPSLRWKASGAGGNWTGGQPTRRQDGSKSAPTLVAAMGTDYAPGRSTCKNSQTKSRSRSRSVITLRAPASGTRSSTGYFRSSA